MVPPAAHNYMKCDLKAMVKIGAVLAGALAIGFLAFPQARPAIAGLAPLALFALCPISMFFAMRGMSKGRHDNNNCSSRDNSEAATERNEKQTNMNQH
jgi:hypothetical protein